MPETAAAERTSPRFIVTIFLAAFLLFQVQPLVGRYVLPWFGGGPAVWTTCLLFFQVLLVAGYAYANWLVSRPSRVQAWTHVALLAASLVFLPLNPLPALSTQASSLHPSARILIVLAASVSGPYLLLAATSPVIQGWFHLSRPGASPWRLYSLSNFGSFLALLSYPFAVEPFLRLRTQAWIWSALYAIFAVACAFTALRLPAAAKPDANRGASGARLRALDVLFWIALAAAGSALLLATTNLISQDVAVIPFLWVAPLSIYLLTFVLVFEHERWYRAGLFAIAAGTAVPAGCAIMVAAVAMSPWWQLSIYLLTLFVVCMICHGELARSRPEPHNLTAFYLAIAAGGALGGAFVAIAAPILFSEFSEYPISLAAACLFGFLGWLRRGALKQWTSRNLAIRVPLMALLIGTLTAVVAAVATNNEPSLASVRNFYGILRVKEGFDLPNGRFRQLTHGRIRHGIQYLRYPQRTRPTSYYGPHSGIGIVLNALQTPNRRIAVVGLGAGTLAAWGRPGDVFRFYEINPDVVSIARSWFSYLADSKARNEIVLGDARVQLERELASGGGHFDVIAVDAFTSDAIPLHLLTAECADVYRRQLAPGGFLLLHISNRLLNLDAVARGVAQHLGWNAVLFLSLQDATTGESTARWVLITGNSGFVQNPEIARHRTPWPPTDPPPLTWTDDFASLWHVLNF